MASEITLRLRIDDHVSAAPIARASPAPLVVAEYVGRGCLLLLAAALGAVGAAGAALGWFAPYLLEAARGSLEEALRGGGHG